MIKHNSQHTPITKAVAYIGINDMGSCPGWHEAPARTKIRTVNRFSIVHLHITSINLSEWADSSL